MNQLVVHPPILAACSQTREPRRQCPKATRSATRFGRHPANGQSLAPTKLAMSTTANTHHQHDSCGAPKPVLRALVSGYECPRWRANIGRNRAKSPRQITDEDATVAAQGGSWQGVHGLLAHSGWEVWQSICIKSAVDMGLRNFSRTSF